VNDPDVKDRPDRNMDVVGFMKTKI